MKPDDWLEWVLFVVALAAITPPLGAYLVQVLDPDGRTWLDPVIRPLERLTYRVLGIASDREQDWRGYAASLLLFSLAGGILSYLVLRGQHRLPLNPAGLGPLSPDLAFNTAVSFITNTDWQSYGGEATMSYFSQMLALTLPNFTSAATGIGVAAALVRGVVRPRTTLLGNFWVDLVRVTYYLLLPGSVVLAVFLVSQGTIQNFDPYTRVTTLEGASQTIVQGPMASQVAIKVLGTNGGGYANANAAHPFENPTPLANFVQMLAIFSLGSGLTGWLGRATGNRAHGWAIWTVMLILFLAGVLGCWWAEAAGNPRHHRLGIEVSDGNLEGKEVRFGLFSSALFAVVTTDATCGAVNAMHDSFTPLGGLIPLFNIHLGGIVFGGVGSGLYGMLLFVVLAVFVAGLMVGRTPEYLGKKIGAFDVRMAMIALLVPCVAILGLTAWATATDWGRAGPGQPGPHGFSQILYAFSSAAGNNGSAFAGLNASTPAYNLTLGLAMLVGRFGMIVPILALAGSLAGKQATPSGAGTLPVGGGTFVLILLPTILLFGALNFLPALVLGPVLEHFLLHQGPAF